MVLRFVCALTVLAAICVTRPADITRASGTPNTWTTDASLASARGNIEAVTSTFDNKIYSIDGQSSVGVLGNLDNYTTSTHTWSTTPTDDATKRAAPGAATTSDGKIYVFGGSSGSALTTSKYYNPSGNAWTTLAALPTARYHLGAAVGSDGRIYIIGGQTTTTWLSTIEAYDPTAAKWYCSTQVAGCTATGTPPIVMPTARGRFGIVVQGGLIYTIGGQTGTSSYTDVVEAYNPSTRTWTCSIGDAASGCSTSTLASMPTTRTVKAAADSNGIIYAIGGYNGASYLSTVEAYNPTTNAWECSSGDAASGCTATPLVAMTTARAYLGLASGSDGNIYAIGGYNGSYLSTVEAYVPPILPGAPTGAAATAGDTTATVNWTAPASTGGTPVTSYTVSCSPACTAVTAAGTSATVTGLTNGTSYTFTVTATNFVGTGAASSPSGAVTPTASCSTSTSNLAVSGGAPGSFSATLTGSDQQVYTTLGSYSVSNTTCSGWSLQFQATQLQNSNGDKFPTGSLLMAAPTVSSCQSGCGAGSKANPPSICIHTSTAALDGSSAITVASAATNTGDGSYTFTPGAIGSGNLQLTVPSYAYATAYTTTITMTVAQGPAGSC